MVDSQDANHDGDRTWQLGTIVRVHEGVPTRTSQSESDVSAPSRYSVSLGKAKSAMTQTLYDIEFDQEEIGWKSASQIQDECQDKVREILDGEEVAFDVEDALAKLMDEGVVKTSPARSGKGRFEYKAKDIQQAIFAIGRTKYRPGDERDEK